ncbi:MAG: glycosyltransferase family 4 protein [Dysgonamonadaceae bacterium]|jgi:glycosyltransferase involved in cell wall biosynthesis|nr:glycosyltransferase family 4 protein [Dysgonamonadaceae bacterium]
MKILFLPNWDVAQAEEDIKNLQSADKKITGQPYWFFKYFPENTEVEVIDRQKNNLLHRLEVKLKFYIRQAILAFKADKKYDAVVSHGAQSGLVYSLLRTVFGKKRPVHIIIDVGGMNGGRNSKAINSAIRFALKSKPAIICHSKVINENYRQSFPDLLPRTAFIPFGVNPDEFDCIQDTETQNFILSFGTSKRDYETLLKAWHLVDKQGIRLKIAGIEYFTSCNIDDSVDFLGKIPVSDLKDLIRKSLFVVIPLPVFNYSYGQMSFLQSMCLGKTVIVTKTPSSIDYIEDRNGAFFVQPYDEQDLKNKIEMLLNDRQLLSENNKKAASFIRANFTEQQMGEEIYKFIKSQLQCVQ